MVITNLEQAAVYWNTKLRAGKPIYRIRVRRLLELQGAERRGAAIMSRIREILERQNLVTEPDFQSVWPDTQISIRLRQDQSTIPGVQVIGDVDPAQDVSGDEALGEQEGEISDPAVELPPLEEHEARQGETLNAPEGAGLVEVSARVTLDPIVRVSSIPSAKRGIVSVLLDDPLEKAMTRMRFSGFSQLAIMQGDREARGIVSWESIAKRLMKSPPPKSVAECRVDAPVINEDASLYDALPTITDNGFVLVRSREKRLVGIVTATDLSAELGKNAYAFMSLRTIEVTIRGKLHPCLTQRDLDTLEEHSKARKECNASYLSFGENVRLMQLDEIWSRLRIAVDKAELLDRLLEIRDIRNDVMHFDPDPLSETKTTKLIQMERFLKEMFV